MNSKPGIAAITVSIFFLLFSFTSFAQIGNPGAGIRGTVAFDSSTAKVRGATVTIVGLGRTTYTDENGQYAFSEVPAGRYDVVVHLDRVPEAVKTVVVSGDTVLDFTLSLGPIREQVTVTATGIAESLDNSYQAVTSLGVLELSEKNSISIGEALRDVPGVANRSYGPGAGRPVVRGFDGDRVLVLVDGLRVGGIASQSGDEVEPIDSLSLDRIEIVKGPATLLYGSNAIGGVVNGISSKSVYQKGLTGYLTALGSTNNWQAGTSGGLKFGVRDFMLFFNGGIQKANDYRTPQGTVFNSYARTGNFSTGAGWFPSKGWLLFSYGYDRRNHGLPREPDEVDSEYYKERTRSYEVRGGFRGLDGFIEGGDFTVRYNDYRSDEFEFESDENKTEFEGVATNKNLNYRANFNQRRKGKFSGTFGFSGFTRDYLAIGAEAPAPRTKQNSIAVYALERIDFERIGFQFGGRVEQNGYKPEGLLPSRSFVGFSGAAGLRIPLWEGGSVVANYQHSLRAPALEELYNNGPHPGLLEYDIGNPNLRAEQGDGVDVSLRHSTGRLRVSGSTFFYNVRDYVFPAFTGNFDEASGLPIVDYVQGNSRYLGAEAQLEAQLVETLWFNGSVDYVRAELTELNKSLPRIPPFRAILGLDWRYKNLSVRPEAILAARQDRVFDNETPTAGYAIFNLAGSYTFIQGRFANSISLVGQNLGNRLYRNHLSFVKMIAPEIGRNIRLSYTVRF